MAEIPCPTHQAPSDVCAIATYWMSLTRLPSSFIRPLCAQAFDAVEIFIPFVFRIEFCVLRVHISSPFAECYWFYWSKCVFTIEIKRTEYVHAEVGQNNAHVLLLLHPDTLLSLLRSMQKMKNKKVSARAFIPHLIPIGHLAANEHDRLHIVAFIEHFRSHAERFLWKRVSYFCCSVFILYFMIVVIAEWMVGGGDDALESVDRIVDIFLFFVFRFTSIRISFFRLLLWLVRAVALRHTGFGSLFTCYNIHFCFARCFLL